MARTHTNNLNKRVYVKNQFDAFTPYEISMIKSFAINAIVTTRTSDRYNAIIDATLTMLTAKGYTFYPESNLAERLRKKFATHNVFSINGHPSKDVIDSVLKFIYELDVVIIKDNSRTSEFHEVVAKQEAPPIKKDWVM